jgi:hypothetical protein
MEKMNRLFKCSDFTVVELKEGSLVNESDLIKKADK